MLNRHIFLIAGNSAGYALLEALAHVSTVLGEAAHNGVLNMVGSKVSETQQSLNVAIFICRI
jgi:hypothetical protein